ncbi:magnesium protoporphyrin IX methyltransferase [Roseiflexus castenholzii]|jgi:magnesium-protoporphyrin O-methyltransferase|uniref:Magnesium protoporphyrin IX methyltransferase n=1 Tax=Roseiflexus castenholzii (strain DSM 13941 / HLO8) TaxID=383372 RepID=A7NJG2_ROSCS|nr:magnesium protoporphyrin IX methyltransferase [Roseiflexus castenholzii]ABU57632.1 magnesium protoporphyrin O-methyltransferase [Roseiflexus castenholzii DSM 13941]
MAMIDITRHKNTLRDYFDRDGFRRWSAIYGDAEVSRIRRTIRVGHARMLARAETWLLEWIGATGRAPSSLSALDAGCGTGLFSIMLAQHGINVTAVDIAPQMVAAAAERAQTAGVAQRITFTAGDIEDVAGVFDVVACFDVLIHYPQPAFDQLLRHLAQRARGMLLFTYAPYEPFLAAMHWIGGFFPRAHRRTEIQMIRENDVRRLVAGHGLRVGRIEPIRSGFYHVNLVEARGVRG